jgi:hypothetical protein
MMIKVKSPPKKDQANNKTATPGKIRHNDSDTSDDDDGRKNPSASKAGVEEISRCSSYTIMRKEDSDSSASHTKQSNSSKGDQNNASGVAAASFGAARESVFAAVGQQHDVGGTNTRPFEIHDFSPTSLPNLPFRQTQVPGAFRTSVLSNEGSRLQHYAQLSQHDLVQRLIGMERENASMKFRIQAIGLSRQREAGELSRRHALVLQGNKEPMRIEDVAQDYQQPQTAVSSDDVSIRY